MIEEIEELVRAYLEAQGYLVKANVRYGDRTFETRRFEIPGPTELQSAFEA